MNTVTVNSNIKKCPKIKISADAELMESFMSAYPVSVQNQIEAVQDNAGNIMVFSMSDDGDLYLVLRDPGGSTGWKQIDLTTSLAIYGKPTNFAVGQVEHQQGRITLAVSIPDSENPDTENIYIAPGLSCDPTDWSKLDSSVWMLAQNQVSGSTIQKIYVGPVDSGTNFGIPYLSVSLNVPLVSEINNYILQINTSLDGWNWIDFPTPNDKKEMYDTAIGEIKDLGADSAGMYILYENLNNDLLLQFKSFEGNHNRGFTVPDGATALQSLPGTHNTTQLFVGGASGVHLFTSDNQDSYATAVNIASSDYISNVQEDGLIVKQDKGGTGIISVWALTNENIQYFSNDVSGTGIWSQPITFLSGIAQMTAIRNWKKNANELVYVGTDLEQNPSIHYTWQDPNSTKWASAEIALESTEAYQYSCYATTLAFMNENSVAIPNLKVKISGSYWQNVIINGKNHTTDTNTPISAVTDSLGNITIITKTLDFSTPAYNIQADNSNDPWFEGTLTVNPAYKIYSKLSAVQSGDDIPDYIFETNNPNVINKNTLGNFSQSDPPSPSDIPNDALENTIPAPYTKEDVANTISQLMALQPNGETMQDGFIVYDDGNQSKKVRTPRLRTENVTGFHITFKDGVPTFHQTPSTNNTSESPMLGVIGSTWNATTNAAGDLWQFAESVTTEVVQITLSVTDDVATFIINTAEGIIRIVLETIEDILKAVWYIFKTLLVLFVKIIEWIGFLFNIVTIWKMHKVIANLITDNLNYFIDKSDTEIDHWKDEVRAGFSKAREALANLVLPEDTASTEIYPSANQFLNAQPNSSLNINSPGTNWTFYQMQHGGALSGSVLLGPPNLSGSATSDTEGSVQMLIQDAIQIYQDAIGPVMADLGKDMNDFQKVLLDILTRQPCLGDILQLINDVGDTFLDVIEGMVLALLDVLEDLLEIVQKIVTTPIDIPIFSALYKLITRMIHSEEELTAANVVSLMLAFPVTTSYKLLVEASPFVNGEFGLNEPGVFTALTSTSDGSVAAEIMDDSQESKKQNGVPFDIKSAYTAIGGFAAAFSGFALNITDFFSLGLESEIDPITKKTENAIMGISLTANAIYVACSLPIPSTFNSESGATFSYMIYGFSGARMFTPLVGRANERAAGTYDFFWSVGQFLLSFPANVANKEGALKYIQDILATAGAAINDFGVMLRLTDGVGAVVRGIGIGISTVGTLILLGRLQSYARTYEAPISGEAYYPHVQIG